ncbi:MAG: RNA polymerase sigma factor [Planctomycetota bacterium]|nr:RNA polymerase sigma factor [Planctomycetota bacterium]
MENSGANLGRMMEEEDAMLVRETIAGHQDSASRLFRKYVDQVFGYLFLKTGRNRSDAEDMVQEVFVDAWRNLPTFRQEARFPAWLIGIAKRKLARHYRDAQTRKAHSARLLLARLSSEAERPGDPVELDGSAGLLMECLSELPVEYRKMLMMKYCDDMTLEQIAGNLGDTVGAVNSKLQRSREALKGLVQKRIE